MEQGALLARLDDADFKQRVRIDEAAVRVRESDLALTWLHPPPGSEGGATNHDRCRG